MHAIKLKGAENVARCMHAAHGQARDSAVRLPQMRWYDPAWRSMTRRGDAWATALQAHACAG